MPRTTALGRRSGNQTVGHEALRPSALRSLPPRARLFASLIGLPLSTVEVDLAAGAHKKADFLALNAFGQLPVLDDDGTIVPDSNATLVYLAKKHGRTD